MMDVLRRAVVATNRFGPSELEVLRIRMRLIRRCPPWWPTPPSGTPSGATSWPASPPSGWGRRPGDLGPQTVARAALGAAVAAFDLWARRPDLGPGGGGRRRLPAVGHRIRPAPDGIANPARGRRWLDAAAAMARCWVEIDSAPVGHRDKGRTTRMKIRAAVCSGLNEPWKVEEVESIPPVPTRCWSRWPMPACATPTSTSAPAT